MKRTAIGVALVIILILGSVVVLMYPSGSNSAGGEPIQHGVVHIYPDTQSNNESVVSMDTNVTVDIENYDVRFNDVMLCFYGPNKSVLEARNLGTFKTQRSDDGVSYFYKEYNQSVSLSTRPYYISVTHPKLDNSSIGVENRIINLDQGWYSILEKSTVPEWGPNWSTLPRSGQPGSCG